MFYYPQRAQARKIQEALKTIYAGVNGEYYAGDDAWEIPYLNPKAKERVGYPTQKPVPVKIQSKLESLDNAKEKLERSSANKGYDLKILIQTKQELATDRLFEFMFDIQIVKSPKLLADELRT